MTVLEKLSVLECTSNTDNFIKKLYEFWQGNWKVSILQWSPSYEMSVLRGLTVSTGGP